MKIAKSAGDNKARWNLALMPLLIVAFGLQVFARTIQVAAQPLSQYADTEASTNIVMHSGRTDVRDVKIRLQLDGTPANNLEIAFGCDANTNGVLDAEETETVYGWRAGRYFIENACSWERLETLGAMNVLSATIDIHIQNTPDIVPRRFSAVCGGEQLFGELAANPPPRWLYRREWNMMRVVRRGAEPPSEWVRCAIEYESLVIRIR